MLLIPTQAVKQRFSNKEQKVFHTSHRSTRPPFLCQFDCEKKKVRTAFASQKALAKPLRRVLKSQPNRLGCLCVYEPGFLKTYYTTGLQAVLWELELALPEGESDPWKIEDAMLSNLFLSYKGLPWWLKGGLCALVIISLFDMLGHLGATALAYTW